MLDVYLRARRDGAAAKRFFRYLFRAQNYQNFRVGAFSEWSRAVAWNPGPEVFWDQ